MKIARDIMKFIKSNDSYFSKDVKYSTENLEESDFKVGFRINTRLYSQLVELRGKQREEYHISNKTFIDGTTVTKSYHPLLGKKMKDSDGKIGIIEAVIKQWHYGFYWALLYRIKGTKSHGIVYMENINSVDSFIIESCNEFKKEWRILK